jgi:microcystin-dependent protein
MPVYDWSETANNNANADPTVNWEIGMAPSAVGSSGRAMMAAVAAYRDDIAGAIVTSGTSTAYTVSSYSGYTSFASLAGQMIAFTPHTTNGAVVTLNVDSLGPKPLRSSPDVELLAGTIIQGTPYVAVYNNSDGAFYLRGFFGNPYNVPLGAGIDFWGSTVPNSSFAFPAGQAVSRTTYSTLFAIMGTTYGTGDGTTTFNLPDKTGRVSAMQEAVSTRLTSSYFGGNSTALGAVGGNESATAPLPAHTHANTLTDVGHTHNLANSREATLGNSGAPILGIQLGNGDDGFVNVASATTGITINNASAGSGGAHNNVQPTIVCNYIIRII